LIADMLGIRRTRT